MAVKRIRKELKVKRVVQGKPYYFIETLEKRSISSKGSTRGEIGTLLIMNYDPRIKGNADKDQFQECYACGLWIDKRNITPFRYWGTPKRLFCLNCRKKIEELFPSHS